MHSGFHDTPLNSKKDLFFLRVLCSLQVFLILFMVISILIIPLGFTMVGDVIYESLKNDVKAYTLTCGAISLLSTIFVVWIFKWYPIITKEDGAKLN